MRRQTSLRPSEGGKFAGPVGQPVRAFTSDMRAILDEDGKPENIRMLARHLRREIGVDWSDVAREPKKKRVEFKREDVEALLSHEQREMLADAELELERARLVGKRCRHKRHPDYERVVTGVTRMGDEMWAHYETHSGMDRATNMEPIPDAPLTFADLKVGERFCIDHGDWVGTLVFTKLSDEPENNTGDRTQWVGCSDPDYRVVRA